MDSRDQFVLNAARGWLMLGNASEAAGELEQISPEQRQDPMVLLLEWEIHAQTRNWDAAIHAAERLLAVAPDCAEGFIKKAFALHEKRRTHEAWECLRPAYDLFSEEWIIPYNLACYACQLGRSAEALEWLRRALRLGIAKERLCAMAREDPDLGNLRIEIEKLARDE